MRRGLAFAGLAIVSVMVGLSFDPVMAVKTGAILCALCASALLWKSWMAPNHPYRRTELWIMLDGKHGLSEEVAQRVFGTTLRACYRTHAELMAGIAAGLWLLGLVLSLAGVESTYSMPADI